MDCKCCGKKLKVGDQFIEVNFEYIHAECEDTHRQYYDLLALAIMQETLSKFERLNILNIVRDKGWINEELYMESLEHYFNTK